MKDKIHVEGRTISIHTTGDQDYISLNDMAGGGNTASEMIKNWFRTIPTIEFLTEWERVYNENFNSVVAHQIRQDAGTIRLTMSVKEWINQTGAIGLQSKAGRYGGTYAHRDIAFEFGTRISARFKILLIKEFQRLKSKEYQQQKLEWDYARYLSKVNYDFQTQAVKENIIQRLPPGDQSFPYASEADMLNMVVFGSTAKQWREANPDAKGNIRDGANIVQLTILANLESINAMLIDAGASQEARYRRLCEVADFQMKVLSERNDRYLLE